MTVDIRYEMIEYGKVLFGYVFLMWVWPSIVFYRHLRRKPPMYRFGFCVTVVPVCLNGLVMGLGLFHALRMALTALILAGIFLVSAVRLVRTCAWELPLVFPVPGSSQGANTVYRGLWGIVLLFGAVYFTYGAFQVSCYGYGDLYTHHSWIYGLMQGEIYKSGVYPEAMHCFVYCMRALFGISVFSCLRFLQCLHVLVFLASAGCLLREMFRWRYTSVLALLLFLTLDVRGADMITPMSRLQWTLPMEFGLPYVFLCVLFFIRYLKEIREKPEDGTVWPCWKNENLLVFTLTVTAVLSIHYFASIMAVLVCLPAALCALRRVLRHLLPLAAAALCAFLVAVTPMAWALAGGTPFEPSINWALGTLSGESAREKQALLESMEKSETENGREEEGVREANRQGGIYRNGYERLYGAGRGALLLGLSAVSLILCLVGRLQKAGWAAGMGAGYVPLVLMSAVYIVTYAMPYMGLPQIVTEGRFCAVGHVLTLAAVLIPLDVAAFLATERWGERLLGRTALLAAVGIYATVRLTGNYHGFLYYELSRYPAAVSLTREIMEDLERDTFVIVSPTDELYQMIEQGVHIELLDFLEHTETEQEYILWRENLFFFVEKRPLYYAQLYFAQGPSWLGEERYPEASREEYETLHPTWRVSQTPDFIASEISSEKAEREVIETDSWQKYVRLENREALESKAYGHCMRLMETYPDQMEIYYEDENFICFYFEQDSGNFCNLAVEREA